MYTCTSYDVSLAILNGPSTPLCILVIVPNRDPVRVCMSCYNRIESLRTPQANSLVNPLDEDSVSQQTLGSNPNEVPSVGGEGGGVNMTGRINSFPGGVSLNSFLEGSDEPLLAHLRNPPGHEIKNGSVNNGGGLFSSSQHSSTENSVEYCVEPLHKEDEERGGGETQALTYTVSSSDITAADPDDEFCVIETMSSKSSGDGVLPFNTLDSRLDVNALRAKLSKLESGQTAGGVGGGRIPSSSSSPQLNRFDEERDGGGSSGVFPGSPDSIIKETNDMEVEGGKVHTVSILVATPRTGVLWQFNSQPKGIAVGLKYQETQDNQGQVEVNNDRLSELVKCPFLYQVLPLRRVMSHKTILTGEYVAQKAGIYTLIFSNAHSK